MTIAEGGEVGFCAEGRRREGGAWERLWEGKGGVVVGIRVRGVGVDGDCGFVGGRH